MLQKNISRAHQWCRPATSAHKVKIWMSAICICMLLTSCTSLPKSVITRDPIAELSVPQNYQEQEAMRSQVITGLFDVFKYKPLEAMVAQSLRYNLDIQFAAKQLEEAGFRAKAEWGNILPQLQGNFSSSVSQDAQDVRQETYSPFFDVTWEVDIWGKLRDQKDARDATTQAKLENYKAIRDSIAAQVMQGWFDVVTAEKHIQLIQLRLNNLQTSAENSEKRYKAGLSSLDDIAAVKRDISQTRALLVQSKSNRNIAVQSLKVLMGQYPDSKHAIETTLPALLPPPKADAPASLLADRPDLRSAWQVVLAADSTVKVSHKELFPTIALTGVYGAQSTSFSTLMSGATIWSLAGGLTVPIFNANKLKNTMLADQSKAEQAWISYLKTMLIAFKEVEQALNRETLLEKQEQEQGKAVEYAQKTARIFEQRYKNGLVSILEYLSAKNTVFDMQQNMLDIRNARLKNRVTLALALGKGV